ncbi:MAG: hypothetical protein ACRC1P_04955 [Cellulosilyticaceae bacterium]
MILAVQILILTIGIAVFMMQHKLKQKMSIVGSKLVYWTTLLFMSLTFNSILFSSYPNNYNLESYFNLNTLIVLSGILIGYIILQIIAPSRSLTKLIKKISKANHKQDEAMQEETYTQDGYLKELHFETFLETVCWLAFVFTVALEAYVSLLGEIGISEAVDLGLKNIVCMMMMVSIPIILRQIIFYLYRIRSIKEEQNLTEVEMKFHRKLRKENSRL